MVSLGITSVLTHTCAGIIQCMAAIEYTHKTNARSRYIRITVQPDGAVVVSSPRYTSKREIEAFVASQQNWITHQRNTLLEKKGNLNELLLFGKPYRKVLKYSTTHKVGFRIEGSTIIYNPTQPSNTVHQDDPFYPFQKQLKRFLKTTAAHYIPTRTATLAKKMNCSYNQLTLKEQKTRWGSCSSQGNLNFNWRLVHYPPAIIDYVIVHELAHLTHMNHSAAFWALVAKFDPQYKLHRNYLKRKGLSVG